MKILQLFNRYLPDSQNWLFSLLSNVPNSTMFIVSKVFVGNRFWCANFIDCRFPIQIITNVQRKSVISRLNNRIYGLLINWYVKYIVQHYPDFDIVHAHFSDVAWDYLAIKMLTKKPLVISFYGYDYQYLPHNKPEWVRRYFKLFKSGDLFLCEGDHGKNILIKMGCEEKKIKVQKLGVMVKNIPSYKREKREQELKLLQIATFTEKKGHIYTVKAFLKACEHCPNMQLTLVGGGNEEIKRLCRDALEGSIFKNKVHILDFVSFEKIHEFMKDFQVFIHPSCYSVDFDCEGGAPVVLLDAQATGLPVISTIHCDIPQEVLHEKTGLLTEERNVEGLAGAIEKFYEMNQARFDVYSQNARNHIENHYDIIKNAILLHEIYANLKTHS